MEHELYDVWRDDELFDYPWRTQGVKFAAYFKTEQEAKTCSDAFRDYRKKNNLDTPNPVRKVK